MLRHRCGLAVTGLFFWILAPRAAAAQVSSADQICGPGVDPCTISSTVVTAPGAVLDFGTRELRVTGGGTIDAGTQAVTIRCGKLTFNTTGTALKLFGSAGGFSEGGFAILEVRKRCSLDSGRTCFRDRDCQLVGAGTCSIGSGAATINGKITGSADSPGSVSIRAAGNIAVTAAITLTGALPDSDGGDIDMEAGGTLLIDAPLRTTSGGLGTGGAVCLISQGDLTISDTIDASGGDFDGGDVELCSDANVLINDSINANSSGGEGFGGSIAVDAGGDIEVIGGTATRRLTITADGHSSSEFFGGDGGPQEYFAGGDVTFGPFVRLTSQGALPDGSGEEILIDAGGNVTFEADVEAEGRGADGGGGLFTLFAGGDVGLSSSAVLDLTGGLFGGELLVDTVGGLTFAGSVDVSAGGSGIAGTADFAAEGPLTISGSITTGGREEAVARDRITISGCRPLIAASARIDNKAARARTLITSREHLTVAGGAQVLATTTGENRFTYRSAAKPPLVIGTVSPAAHLVVDATLSGCPVCGNGELDGGETCEDGNLTPGDGCSADCQDEGCIADTPGWPAVPLCDDGSACTVDSCNVVTASCRHVVDCDDGIPCTSDRCGDSGVCVHDLDDAACSDGTACTIDRCCDGSPGCGGKAGCSSQPDATLCDDGNECTADSCAAGSGCVNTPNEVSCDDGLACTVADACSGGICTGVANCPAGEICDAVTGTCEIPPTTTTLPTTTTSSSTTTVPVDVAVCGNGVIEQTEACDDGDASWQTGQFCDATCSMLTCGDPDDSGSITASDALFLLRVAVKASTCDRCVCDVDSSGGNAPVNASDALRVLRAAVKIPVVMSCPPCI